MTSLILSYEQPLIHAVGWSLLHFLWEGAIVALLLTSALRLLSEFAHPNCATWLPAAPWC